MEFRADLHCHTSCSDGTLSPSAVIQMACELQLQGLSITDHDTIEAYREAIPVAKSHHLPLIPGVELSAVHRQTSIHLLAYSFPFPSSIMEDFCRKHHQRRLDRNKKMLELLASKGIFISDEDLIEGSISSQTHPSIGRPHIAQALIKKGYVKTIQQAFHEYIGEGKPCYVNGDPFSVEQTLEVIHQAKGLAIIAHPHLIEKTSIVKDLLEMPFDGIEGYYGRFPRQLHERWIKIGAYKGWIITGGSDFHGAIKPEIPLGSSWVNQETFEILQQHFQKNQRMADSPNGLS